MRAWEARSPDVAAMLNPALIAMVTAGAASEFTRISGDPFPFAYAFLVSPLVLDHDTREALPRRTDSHLTKWAGEHPVLAAQFPPRARAMVPLVREGLRFGIRNASLEVVDAGLHGHQRERTRPARVGDIAQIIGRAGFVGRWFATLDRPATVFAVFGVEP